MNFTKSTILGPTQIFVGNAKPYLLYFGCTNGSRHFNLNDIEIIPDKDSQVVINVFIEKYDKYDKYDTHSELDNQINLEICNPIRIYQRPTEPYPSFLLNAGIVKCTKKYLFQGIISIQGNCTVNQTIYQCRDV